ncbi:hormogonium polysaccharide biosynthesis glycosyltransferase HpsE [Lyngbya sp. CCY1209]|jgi:glycosyltransferase involved in cell wall biosynthesis|uniref:hormogonium polysaccharide biosynthesis glycosyltransferase HpsE n=1 Tax=Lyngbya sp. CCY1209 TaxID=2886103 RepID=UPI002D1FEE26|nr:hormogonium polysaccharide biosynthesis glycosyltransferase HpsE [Lyngbya sp. CCY1209]MEB3885632.1 hormogonium polysaccharide biosynthesis glycosyltransferase HpsE [Lyngbya sp. CCY1209]
MLDLTVAIPTYNGEKRLPEVLEKLRSQTGTDAIVWEVLVVDNNSSDGTAEVVRQYQQNWLSDVPLRYCLETQQGAAFARKRAVQESQAELIGFLDDDNVPQWDWVSEAVKFSREYPQAGAYGSQIHGIFEAEPPPNFERIKAFLAITERGSRPHLYEPKIKMLPPSAGLVVRRRTWLENVPSQMILTGRVGGQMLASEDLEVLRYIQKAGWEIWYNPDMAIDHLIPQHRLEKDYLMKLCFGVGLSSHAIRMLKFPQWQRPPIALAYLLNDIRKIIIHLFKYKLAVYTEIVAASEMQFLIGRFFSPFYFMLKPHQTT